MRYIIECKDPKDIPLGARAISKLIEYGTKDMVATYDSTNIWYIKKTKTGYSARESEQ